MSYDESLIKWNGMYVKLWLVNCLLLLGLAFVVPLTHWLAAFGLLFFIPEMVGLRRHQDRLPPLTFVVRRYLPRWVPDLLTFAFGATLAILYPNPVFWVGDAGMVGWLTNHWSVTYDN